jgi:malonyl-CoA decarboxylase
VKQSAGLMVNYLYKLDDIEQNHEAYAREGRVAVSDQVKRLLKKTS